MLEKPKIDDKKIIAVLKSDYGISATQINFLPIGNASNTWIYSVDASEDKYFLKLKKGGFDGASIETSRYLYDSGISAIVAPLSTQAKKLWAQCDEYVLILFSYIDATSADASGLSHEQWREFGKTLSAIHKSKLPEELTTQLKVETFISEAWLWIEKIKSRIDQGNFADSQQGSFADFWNQKQEVIENILKRAKESSDLILENPPDNMICHTDIHLANVLVSPDEQIHIVDWDAVMLAPKERDLMFILGRDEASLFFEGYGRESVDQQVLSYYRCDWVLQELTDYGDRVFFSTDAGEETRREAVAAVIEMFKPGNVVDQAENAER
jgi:spectinomycin phosphotransferase